MPDRITTRVILIAGRNVALRLERLYWRDLQARAKRGHMKLTDLLAAAIGGADTRTASAIVRRKLFAWRGAEIAAQAGRIRDLESALAEARAELKFIRSPRGLPSLGAAALPAAPVPSSPPGRQGFAEAAA
ncbi:hypothetical protein RA307_26100 [Xanthobacteraceae bacterium Astr-EGSB]|uniref:hypothetical protein n=1 Tax=Astrobacterium formosum TaxID=3069710 RepID=UPI0027AFF630|nr:hypothetical protein [Xanthobacteraceae bacterium Astr-EGSB]